MSNKFKETLRWIALPLAAVVATALAFAFCSICQLNEINNQYEEGYGSIVWAFLSFFSSGCAFVYVAIMVAPRQKHIVAIVATSIAIVICLIWGITGIVATLDKQNSLTVFAITSTIGGIMGALAVGLDRYSHFKKLLVHSTTLHTKGKYTETKNKETHLEKFNDYNDIEGPQKVVELLLKQHTNEQAIDITIENLAKELSKHNNTSDGWSEDIDKLLQVLDIIQPLDQGDTYSHIANPEMLAEIATIDYEKIANAISQFTKMAHNADIRMQAILAIMTGPAMKVQADKLYHKKQLYKDTINCLQKLQNKLPDTFCVDDNKVMASSKMYIIDGKVFGFICDGKMYCPNTGYSKALLHLYTYVWMKHHKRVNIGLYDTIYNYVVTTDYFHHILSSPRFSDLDYEEAAIKAYCYMVAFDGTEIYFDEKKKQELLERHSDDVIFYDKEDLIRLPLLSIINKSIDLSATLKTL